jgi:hypothetical protein
VVFFDIIIDRIKIYREVDAMATANFDGGLTEAQQKIVEGVMEAAKGGLWAKVIFWSKVNPDGSTEATVEIEATQYNGE